MEDLIPEVRRISDEIVDAKAKGDSSTVDKLMMEGSLLFVKMRAENRRIFTASEDSREAVAEARAKVDAHHLQLENLKYVNDHLNREIKLCCDFTYVVFVQ
jgi:hypothetical protein